MNRFARRAAVAGVLLCLLFLVSIASAQQNTADVVGTVTDASGAVVPGAIVTITNLGTNISASATTESSGDFTFTLLQVGTYSLKVESKGFKAFSVSSLALSSGDRARVDAKLEVGDVSQTVEVSGTVAPALQTDTSNVGTLVTSQAVEDLPLNGRNIVKEIQLAPGITEGAPNGISSGTRPDDRRQTSSFSVNGQSDSQNNELIDGMDNNERIIGGIGVRPSVDAIQEVNVSTNLYDASAGRTAGGVVDLITKSGTNGLHGSAYEFFRNKVLNTNPNWNFAKYLNPTSNSPVSPNSPFRQNQYGGSLGGPIIKNKTFFFGDFEQLKRANGAFVLETIPSVFEQNSAKAMIAGSGGCNCVDFTDIGGPQVPKASVDPIGLAYFEMYPTPTNTATTNNFAYSPLRTQSSTTFDARIDEHISDKDTIFGRYSFNDVTTVTPSGLPNVTLSKNQDPLMTTSSLTFNPGVAGGSGVTQFPGKALERQQAFALSYTHIVNPNLVATLKAGYLRSAIRSFAINVGQPIANELGLPCNTAAGVCSNVTSFLTSSGLTGVSFANGNITYQNLGDAPFTPILEFDNSFQYAGVLNWIKGAHSIRIGLGVIRRQATIGQSNNGFGAFTFGGYYTGFPMADLVEGLAGSQTRAVSLVEPSFRTWEPSTYVQDDWRARRWLTLNLGVRYDIFTPYTEHHGRFSNFDIASGLIVSPSISGSQQASATDNVKVDFHDVAPRIGFSASLPHSTVLRGGFGFSYFPTNYQSQYYMKNAPFNYSFTCGIAPSTTVGACSALFASTQTANKNGASNATGGPQLALGQPLPVLNGALATNTANYPGQVVQAYPYSFPWGYLEQANLTFQKQFGENVINVGWVGAFGHHLGSGLNINSPANYTQAQTTTGGSNPNTLGSGASTIFPLAVVHPFDGSIAVTEEGNYGASAYDSLQTSFVRRFSHGLTVNVGYTWSHALSLSQPCTPDGGQACFYDKSGASYGNPSSFAQVLSNQLYGWGNSGQDTRHRITGTVNYQLPFAGHATGVEAALFKGWAMNAATSWQTGLPFTVTDATARRQSFTGLGESPDQVKSGRLANQSLTDWIDGSAFVLQTKGSFGTQRPNQLYGPPQRKLDFSLFKDFQVTERLKLQFRTEVFNLFNTTNFGTPTATVATFGNNTNLSGGTADVGASHGNFGVINSVNPNIEQREIQFAAKFVF